MQRVTYEDKQGYLDENTNQFYPRETFQEVTYEGKKGIYHPETKQFFEMAEPNIEDIPSPGPVANTFLSMLKSLSEPRGAATTLGMIGGGSVGGASGLLTGGTTSIPGAILGAGLGGAGAGQAYDRLMEILGAKKKETPLEATTTALAETGEFAAAEAVPQIGVPILNKLLGRMPWAKKGLTEAAQKLLKITKEENIPLPAAAITGDKGQMAVTQTLGQMPQAQRTVENEIADAWKGIAEQGERGKIKYGLNVEPRQAGQHAQTGTALEYQRLNEQGKALHNNFVDLAKDDPIFLRKARSEGQKILTEDQFKILPVEVRNTIETIIDATTPPSARLAYQKGRTTITDVVETTNPIVKKLGQPSTFETVVKPGTPTGNISSPVNAPIGAVKDLPHTLTQVDELRKLIGGNAGFEKVYADKADAFMRRIGKAVDEDIFDSLSKSNPVAYKAFRAEKDFYKSKIFGKFKGINIFKQETVSEKIQKMDPSTVLNQANTIEGLSQLQNTMPKTYYDVVRKGKIAEILEPTLSTIDTSGYGQLRVYDGYKLREAIYGKGMTPEYRSILFKPEELDAMDRLIATSESMKSLQKYGGSQSGTPKGYFYGRMLSGEIPFGTGAAGYFVGGTPGVFIGATVGMMAPYGVAKFITSDAGKKYLIEGVKLNEGTKQLIRAGGVTFLDFMKSKEKKRGDFPSVGP